MGNSELQSYHNTSKPILVAHPMFEQAKIVKNAQGREVIQIGISMKSEKDFLVWEKNYKRIPKIPSLLYPEEVKFENSGCCGSSGFAMIQYPRCPYILAEQIEIRKQNNMRHFEESQLWVLLYSLLSCAEIFHIRKMKIGDIRPQNIFMNEQGSIKVASQFSFPYESVNYQKTLMNRELVTYLAPEEVRDLQLGRMKDSSQPSLVQPFSIGLTLLDAVLLEDAGNFYLPNGIFGLERLREALNRLNDSSYSAQLIQIIRRLCEPNQQKRIKLNELLQELRPYENEILLKKPFNTHSLSYASTSKLKQNPQSCSEISRISIKKTSQATNQTSHKFINGVVFDHFQNSIQFSSLNQSKQVLVKNSRQVNSYEVRQSTKMNQLNCPVQTTIYRPPVVVSIPPPVQHGYNPLGQQQGNQHA